MAYLSANHNVHEITGWPSLNLNWIQRIPLDSWFFSITVKKLTWTRSQKPDTEIRLSYISRENVYKMSKTYNYPLRKNSYQWDNKCRHPGSFKSFQHTCVLTQKNIFQLLKKQNLKKLFHWNYFYDTFVNNFEIEIYFYKIIEGEL